MKYGNTRAVSSHVFLLVGRTGAPVVQFANGSFVSVQPFGWCKRPPVEQTLLKFFPSEVNECQIVVIGLYDLARCISDHDTDNICVNQALKTFSGNLKRVSSLLALRNINASLWLKLHPTLA